MPVKSSRIRIAIAMAIVVLAVARFVSDDGAHTSRGVVLTGVLVGLVVVLLIVLFTLRLLGSRRRRMQPVLDNARRTGATVFLCTPSRENHYGVVAVADGALTITLGPPGPKQTSRTWEAGEYSLREGPVPLSIPGEVPGLQVIEHESVSCTLLVLGRDQDASTPRRSGRERDHQARLELIAASESSAPT